MRIENADEGLIVDESMMMSSWFTSCDEWGEFGPGCRTYPASFPTISKSVDGARDRLLAKLEVASEWEMVVLSVALRILDQARQVRAEVVMFESVCAGEG
jgi:hypothetical protein